MATPAPPSARRASAIPHFPGLEGLRGVAVVAVVAYHARYDWMRGGFLGVSTFFTLSGFLITSLLLNERGATGTIDLRSFWRRRFRRLMPAALAALALVVAYGYFAADEVQKRNLAGDVLAALGYVANWRFLFAQQSYADIFGQASPVAHFWSLAIEEQFYLFLPLIAWFLLIRLRLGRAAFAVGLVVLTAASLALTVFGHLSADATYYHTGTRAAELLVGALMAAFVFDRRVTRPLGRNRGVQAVVCTVGIAAFAVSVWMWTIVDHSGDKSPWLYKGGFAAYSLLTAAVILASVVPAGPVRWVLALWPVRFLGKISYGVYLYHWPVFLWLTTARTGLDEPQLSAARLAVTLVLALVSFHLIETPIRHAGTKSKVRLKLLAAPVVVGITGAVIAITVTAPQPIIDFEAAAAQLAAMNQRSGPPPPPPDLTSTTPPRPRMAIYGDSTAMMTSFGLNAWAGQTNKADIAPGVARLGCGIGRGGERLGNENQVMPIGDICNRWELEFSQSIESGQPNIAIVQVGPWEVATRRLEGSDKWTALGDPVYDSYLMEEMLRAVDVLSSQGAVVTWMTSPYITVDQKGDEYLRGGPSDRSRMDRLNEMIRQLPAKRPGRVAIVPLAEWFAELSPEEDKRLRPDGVHFKDWSAKEVMDRFLGDAIVTAFKDTWAARVAQKDSDSFEVDDENIGKYIDVTFKALLVGDRSADLLTAGVKRWGDRYEGMRTTPLVRADCGLLRTSAREGPNGAKDPTPPDCKGFRQAVIDAAKREEVDFVIVVPSAWDLRPVRLDTASTFATWGDANFEKTATQQYQELVRQLNDVKAVVLWANLPVGDPAKGGPDAVARQIATADKATAQRYEEALVKVEANVPRGNFHRIDMTTWTAKRVPAFADGSDLTDELQGTIGEWLAKQSFTQYEHSDKLREATKKR